MLKIARILRDYREAGSVNSLLAPWGFVDDTTFLTKAGHVGVVYQVRGIDYEGVPPEDLRSLVHRVEAALRLLDEHCRLYQYLIKRVADAFSAGPCHQPVAREAIQRRVDYLNAGRQDLYEIDLYLVLLYEPPASPASSTRLQRVFAQPREALRAWLGTTTALSVLESELDRALGTLHHKAQAPT